MDEILNITHFYSIRKGYLFPNSDSLISDAILGNKYHVHVLFDYSDRPLYVKGIDVIDPLTNKIVGKVIEKRLV